MIIKLVKVIILIFILIPSLSFARVLKATTNISVVAAGAAVSIKGQIDSRLVNRFNPSGNAIYVFQGSPTVLGEKGSSSNAPLMVVPVSQDKCVFSYQLPALASGTYTLALTQQAQTDLAGTIENITYVSRQTVNYQGTLIAAQDFNSTGRVLKVGVGKTYAKPSLAINASQNGDLIEVDSGTYVDDFASISTNITIRGVGATRPHLQQINGVIPNGKGILTTDGIVAIENFEISGARVPDQNGAGVRIENDTVICNSYLYNNENGVLGDANNARIEFSEFAYNGLTDVGYTHNIYINGGTFTLIYSYIHDAGDPNNTADTGHNVKSRAKTNYILYNRIMNEAVGTASDQINIPQGGLTYIVGNVIRESPLSNSNRIILYYDNGNDGAANPSLELFMVNNTIVSDDGEVYLTPGSGTKTHVHNNFFWGTPKTVPGTTQSNNIFSSNAAHFKDKANFDFHLAAGAPAINAGMNPSLIPNFNFNVDSEYVHPTSMSIRKVDTVIDAGAFEF